MNGALMKASGRFAIAAALGLVLGASSARAADLGGNCCADLEERVAELEATTARKGNRKMSLTITGQVNRTILWWNDGQSSKAYYGLDNTNSSSRFSILGEAKISPRWKMGFEIMIEIEAGGTSSKASQLDEDGKILHSSPLGNNVSFNAGNVDAYFGDARRVAWWIEDAQLGRITIGRYESAGVIQTIDLGGIAVVAGPSFNLLNGAFFLRGTDGSWKNMTWSNLVDPAFAQSRTELLRWDSPVLYGFTLSASIAEAGDYWGTMLRYANEFNGVRVAWGIGYEKVRDRATPVTVDPTAVNFTGVEPDVSAWGVGGAVLHVPTGLFLQGHYNHVDFGDPPGAASGYWGQGTTSKKDVNQWLIQGGIARNWTGYGNTAFYGEYGQANDWGAAPGAGRAYAASSVCTTPPFTGNCTAGFTAIAGVTDTKVTVWGLGIVQNLDAAATELYLGYRHFNAEITATAPTPLEDLHVVAAGARVKF